MRDWIRSYEGLLWHLAEGGFVMLTRGDSDDPEAWSDPRSGRSIDARVARKALLEGEMIPSGDGLLGDSQTYKAKVVTRSVT